MGLSGIGIWQLLIILVIVLLLFGTKRLKGLGGDLGGAIKGFKKAMSDDGSKSGEAEKENEPGKVADQSGSDANLNQEQAEASDKKESVNAENKS